MSGRPVAPTLGTVLRGAGSTYRAHPRPVMGLAVLVFGVSAMLDTLASRALSGLTGDRLSDVGLTLVVGLLTGPLSFSTAGLVLYAGILDRVVGHHLHGHERVTVRGRCGRCRGARLLAADAILVVGTSIGAALFVIPGLIVFTSFCLVGPLSTSRGSVLQRRFAVRQRSCAERRGRRSCSPRSRRMSRSRWSTGSSSRRPSSPTSPRSSSAP